MDLQPWGADCELVALHREDGTPSNATGIDRLHNRRRPASQQPDTREDLEDVERVGWSGPTGHGRFEPWPVFRRDAGTESVHHLAMEPARLHPGGEIVSEPVRLHYSTIEGIRQPVLIRNQPEVRIGSLETESEVAELPIGFGKRPLDQRRRIRRTTQTEPIRRVGISRE